MMQTEHIYKAVIRAFEDVLADDTNASMDRRRKDGQFHFIPFDMEQFIDQLDRARTALLTIRSGDFIGTPIKFVDAGCGVGTKVLTAHSMSHYSRGSIEAYGIEIEPKYVKAARKLLREKAKFNNKERIIQGDARAQHYGGYDIVYFYRPMCDPKLQLQLETRILSTTKKGSIIIANGSSHEAFGTANRRAEGILRDVDGNHQIFLKVK